MAPGGGTSCQHGHCRLCTREPGAGHSPGRGSPPSTCCRGFASRSSARTQLPRPQGLCGASKLLSLASSGSCFYSFLFPSLSCCQAFFLLLLGGCRTRLLRCAFSRSSFLPAPFSSPSSSLCLAAAAPSRPRASPASCVPSARRLRGHADAKRSLLFLDFSYLCSSVDCSCLILEFLS